VKSSFQILLLVRDVFTSGSDGRGHAEIPTLKYSRV
jgi:hypothetical protein